MHIFTLHGDILFNPFWEAVGRLERMGLKVHPESRRKTQSLKVCFNIVNNLSIIPPSYFSFHPHPSPRRPHNLILYKPIARTNSYFFSFFVNVVSLWNQLPSHIVSSFSSSAFKHQLSSNYL